MELKTLKDLILTRIPGIKKNACTDVVLLCKLKAEAVKWVKRLGNYESIPWKNFFNLTEEDLK